MWQITWQKGFKIRLKNSNISKGKRSGYQDFPMLVDDEQKVRLLTFIPKVAKQTFLTMKFY